MGHSGTEMGDSAGVCLLHPAQIGLRNQNMAHGEHSETSDFFRGVEDDRGETSGHLGVQADLDSGLDLVFAFHEQIE